VPPRDVSDGGSAGLQNPDRDHVATAFQALRSDGHEAIEKTWIAGIPCSRDQSIAHGEGGTQLAAEALQVARHVDRVAQHRELHAPLVPHFDGRDLTLFEDFVHADGETDRRIWRITPLGDGRYEGRADDVVGAATGEARGNALHWQYDMNLPIGDGVWQVHFDDWMLLQSDDVLINRATVSKLGITLGEVTLFFRKS
jgi:hypothetical protein